MKPNSSFESGFLDSGITQHKKTRPTFFMAFEGVNINKTVALGMYM